MLDCSNKFHVRRSVNLLRKVNDSPQVEHKTQPAGILTAT